MHTPLLFTSLHLEFLLQVLYNTFEHAGVAQLFRARPCQGRGPGLESLYPHQFSLYIKVPEQGLFVYANVILFLCTLPIL
jgi:hypothetical protein